jgi:hypothetical protein
MEAEAKINLRLLQDIMEERNPILDISKQSDLDGAYLNAERGYLEDNGWTFNDDTGYWMPPDQ